MTRASRVPQPTLDLSRRSLFGAVLGIGALATLQACGGEAEGGPRRGRGRHRQVGLAAADHVGPGHLLGRLGRADARPDLLRAHAHRRPGQRRPHLAESWKYDKDGTAVTFTLRDGLVFSDGSPIDAAAVKKSLERGRDADNSLIAAQLTN